MTCRPLASVLLLLAGCAAQAPAPVVVTEQAPPPALPGECTARDAVWLDLPDKDVTRSEGVRNIEDNRARYERLLTRRAVCRAAIQSLSRSADR